MIMAEMEGTLPIPSPPGLPFLGNIKNINPELPLESFVNMADKYGQLYSGEVLQLSKLIILQVLFTSSTSQGGTWSLWLLKSW